LPREQPHAVLEAGPCAAAGAGDRAAHRRCRRCPQRPAAHGRVAASGPAHGVCL